MNYAKCALVFVPLSVVLSCEGTTEDKTLTLLSEAALDGYVTWVSQSSYTGSASDASVSIGDVGNDTSVTRCVVSFNLSSLPAGAQIQSAVLRVYQNAVSSGNSYADPAGLGAVFVDDISYTSFTPGEGLFHTDSIEQNIGTLATSFSPNTWHELDVTTPALDEVSQFHYGRLQFRIYHHYQTNNDDVKDTDDWVMGDSPTNQPELVITYR